MTAKVKAFGNYTVMLDTVPPTIINLDLKAAMAGRTGFRLRIGDDLSGVDQWVGKAGRRVGPAGVRAQVAGR